MGEMKANRKFIKGEKAVSAVIGVILMVAITVAIAATVYVYVSGMLTTSKVTPSVGATYEASTKVFTLANPTASDILWSQVGCKLVNNSATANAVSWLTKSAGGIYITAGDIVTCSTKVVKGFSYTFSLVYNTTGGSLYTSSWTQTV